MSNHKNGKTAVGQIVSELAKGEGKLVQVSVGNIREVVALVSDMIYKDESNRMNSKSYRGIVGALYRNGERRHKIAKRVKRK